MLAGILIGIVIFAVGEWIAPRLVLILKSLSLPMQIASVLLLVALMFGVDRGIAEIAAAGSPKPAEWQARYDRIIDDLAGTREIALMHRPKHMIHICLEKLMQNQRDSAPSTESVECAGALDDPRVAERKAEFATVEPRDPLFICLLLAGFS